MSAERLHGKWRFGLTWIVANIAGWGFYLVLVWAAAWLVWELYEAEHYRLLASEGNRTFVALAIAAVCWGAILGWLQQFVLTRRFQLEDSKWAWATLIGIAVRVILQNAGLFVMTFLPYSFSFFRIIDGVATFAAPLALGIAQWYVLRRYFARAGWWIAATALAPWLGQIVLRILPAGDRTYMASAIISLLVHGFFYGAATWAVLVMISRQPAASVESEEDRES